MGFPVGSGRLSAWQTFSCPMAPATVARIGAPWVAISLQVVLLLVVTLHLTARAQAALNVNAAPSRVSAMLPGAPHKNVLILHEGSRALPYQTIVAQRLEKDLSSDSDVQVFEEFLDDWRLGRVISRERAALETKYFGTDFNVVVADGAGALQLLLDAPPEFLHGTPVVFLTIADFRVPASLPPNMTGIATHVGYAATVRMATMLQPGLKHLYYIDDEPHGDNAKNAAIQQEFRPFRGQLDIVFWEHDDLNMLLKKVSNLPPHSAVLFDTYFGDSTNRVYIPADVCAQVSAHANVPVYTVYRTMIGKGPVGGVVVNFETIGHQAGKTILAILHGVKVSELPVQGSQNDALIDWKQFRRYGLAERRIPSTATVLYREPTLWERYRGYSILGGLIFLLQASLIVKLAIEGWRRKKSEESTRELAGRLIHAQEKERRRIAGELHDDVSQRLALVCIQLDALRRSPPRSKEALIEELSVLYDETDLISSDIHQFSHELHPAILERLGLVSALRRYCTEFSLHRKIAVNLQIDGDEPPMHPEIALALFRVGQECLMNIAKHSGVSSCSVTLRYVPHRAILKIEDEGNGYEVRALAEKSSLGIESMRERLRSIGGTLLIQSALGRYTRIRAEAPIIRAQQKSTNLVKVSEDEPNVPAA